MIDQKQTEVKFLYLRNVWCVFEPVDNKPWEGSSKRKKVQASKQASKQAAQSNNLEVAYTGGLPYSKDTRSISEP